MKLKLNLTASWPATHEPQFRNFHCDILIKTSDDANPDNVHCDIRIKRSEDANQKQVEPLE